MEKEGSSQLGLDMPSLLPDRWRLVGEHVVLYKWQSDCLEKWIARGNGIVKVATGGGKTIFALAAAQALQNRKEPDLCLAIVVPTIPLMHQWRDELKDANMPASAIGLMGGEKKIQNPSALRVLICVINSAREHLPKLIKSLNWSSKLLLIVDECHRANANKARKIFDTYPRYTLGLSATPESDKGDEDNSNHETRTASEITQALGPIIFDFSLKESMKEGLLTPFEIWHIGLDLTVEEHSEYSKLSREITELRKNLQVAYRNSKSRQGFLAWCNTRASRHKDKNSIEFVSMTNERKRLIYRATCRADLTLHVLSLSMKGKNRKAIVFHESVDEINKLFISAYKKQIPALLEHSKLPDKIRAENINFFRKGIARTIISAKSLVEGFNVPSADIGIIAASNSSVRQRIQSLGRMLRKTEKDETAIIFVLYIKDTVDEAIYQNADWESIIGTKRNRYFEWVSPTSESVSDSSSDLYDILREMQEIDHPPRSYRPPCQEMEGALDIGSIYPAKTIGMEMKVDRAGNLRPIGEDDVLARASKEQIDKILELNNQYRRAVRTPCGHLIVRKDTGKNRDEIWIYLGNIALPEKKRSTELRVKSIAGRRVIAKKINRREEVYAQEGETCRSLLSWISREEKERNQTVNKLYWDGKFDYWIELDGERISFPGDTASLEFPR